MAELILYPCLIAFVFAELSGVVQSFSRWLHKYDLFYKVIIVQGKAMKIPSPLKPFGCGKCLAFWLTGVVCHVNKIGIYQSLAYMSLSFIIVMFAKLLTDYACTKLK
jgi:hypothetical protein